MKEKEKIKKDKVEEIEFKAEVKQVLDIVINSIYTDKEIFVRELISNAADALEKLRFKKMSGEKIVDEDLPLEINIEVDEKSRKFTITDSGIGMTRKELVENLGTIAKSGSKKFLEVMKNKDKKDLELIGQFGVGFYSSFMVSNEVIVKTRSFKAKSDSWIWRSDGNGKFFIEKSDELKRGTSVSLILNEEYKEFSEVDRIKDIIKEYSNFIPFDIKVNGEKVNTVEALWMKNKSDIEQKEYDEFYKFISNNYDTPRFTMHFKADAPLSINALLFVPKSNKEKFLFDRLKPGVSLYCKKIMINKNMDDLLPEWLRFLSGVVDSEDIPLNISRETMQDTMLVKKLRKVITRRFCKFLADKAKKNIDEYNEFYREFSNFLKEGLLNDPDYKDDIVELLRFESSKKESGKTVSLKEYVEGMKEDQKEIYYVSGSNREEIEKGPFISAFKEKDIEVLYLYENADDFVMSNIGEYKEKKLISLESPELKLPGEEEDVEKHEELCKWLKDLLSDKVQDVTVSKKPISAPAVVTSLDSHMTTRMQKIWLEHNKTMAMFARYGMQINPKNELIQTIDRLRKDESKKELVEAIARQVMDNAMLVAGLIDSPLDTVDRINKLLSIVVNPELKYEPTEADKEAEKERLATKKMEEEAEKARLEAEVKAKMDKMKKEKEESEVSEESKEEKKEEK